MMQSGLILFAISGRISGSGLAMAKIIGFSFMLFKISSVNKPGCERPIITSDPSQASASDLFSVSAANYVLIALRPGLP